MAWTHLFKRKNKKVITDNRFNEEENQLFIDLLNLFDDEDFPNYGIALSNKLDSDGFRCTASVGKHTLVFYDSFGFNQCIIHKNLLLSHPIVVKTQASKASKAYIETLLDKASLNMKTLVAKDYNAQFQAILDSLEEVTYTKERKEIIQSLFDLIFFVGEKAVSRSRNSTNKTMGKEYQAEIASQVAKLVDLTRRGAI